MLMSEWLPWMLCGVYAVVIVLVFNLWLAVERTDEAALAQ
jgi:hypothetical protein